MSHGDGAAARRCPNRSGIGPDVATVDVTVALQV